MNETQLSVSSKDAKQIELVTNPQCQTETIAKAFNAERLEFKPEADSVHQNRKSINQE